MTTELLDARATNAAVKAAVQSIGPMFFFDPVTTARGQELGYNGLQFYIAGRGGVIGEADGAAAAEAFHYFEPSAIAAMWADAAAIGPFSAAAAAYAESCHAWGRTRLAGLEGVERLAELAGRVVEANDLGSLTPLYTGWRALPMPEDAPARAAHLFQALREHRGDMHAVALRVHRVPMLDAQVAEGKDAGMIKFFGWAEPFPEPDEALQARRAAAEELTDELVASAYAVLDAAEQVEFSGLAQAALAHVKG